MGKRMKKSATLLLVVIFLMFFCAPVSLPVKGDSKRTLVVPDDYKTIGDAIGVAVEGDSIFVKKGTYHEQVLTINKTLSINGENAKTTILKLHPPLIFGGWQSVVPCYYYDNSIKIYANGVELSNFTIVREETSEAPADLANHTLGKTKPPFIATGGGEILVSGNQTTIVENIVNAGLDVEGSYQIVADNTLASGVSCSGSYNNIFSNVVTGSGISVGGLANQVYANDIVGEYKISTGIQSSGDGTIIANNSVLNCNAGLGIYRSYDGSAGSNNIFYGNNITKNVYGIVVNGGNNNTFYGNELVNNTVGAKVGYLEAPEPTATFYHNNFIGSIEQVSLTTSVTYIAGVWSEPFYVAGFFDNDREGNYWSDYEGADSNGDGIGDTPYIIDANRQDNYPHMAPFNISNINIPSTEASPEPSQIVSFTTSLAITIASTIFVVGLGLLIYFKKYKQKS